jgi:hypothetical protein
MTELWRTFWRIYQLWRREGVGRRDALAWALAIVRSRRKLGGKENPPSNSLKNWRRAARGYIRASDLAAFHNPAPALREHFRTARALARGLSGLARLLRRERHETLAGREENVGLGLPFHTGSACSKLARF